LVTSNSIEKGIQKRKRGNLWRLQEKNEGRGGRGRGVGDYGEGYERAEGEGWWRGRCFITEKGEVGDGPDSDVRGEGNGLRMFYLLQEKKG